MPQLNPSSFVSQIFWLTVTFLSLWLVMSVFILPRIAEIIDERRAKIDADIQKAERVNKKAELTLERYEEIIEKAKKRADEEIFSVRQQLEADIELKRAQISSELGKKIADNEALIKREREQTLQAVNEIALQTSDLILQKLGFNTNKEP